MDPANYNGGRAANAIPQNAGSLGSLCRQTACDLSPS
jgi:hypothetical protein